ncbi:MAG: hypothetical protein ACI4D8_02875 [Wujia sp.]
MTQNNAKILLFLLAVLLFGGVYMYVYKPNIEDKEALQSECDSLQTQLNDLKAKNANREIYEQETVQYMEDVKDILAYYPASYDQELTVMFIKGIEDAHNGSFEISNTGLSTPSLFYTLGGITNEDGTTTSGYQCYTGTLPITYTGTYDGVQDFLEYIMGYRYRMNVSSINITYDSENDICSGSITMNAYYITGEDREGDTVEVDVPEGVSNLFTGGAGAGGANTYAYDADNGASIVTDNDVKIILNNANNDATDGIIVAAGDKDTYVTSSANDVVSLEIKVEEEDGKMFYSYEIAGDSYREELTGSDLKIYVQSSQRVDSDDVNGVEVKVVNSTSVPVFFKVDGDDTVSPRFIMGRKTGKVKVY